ATGHYLGCGAITAEISVRLGFVRRMEAVLARPDASRGREASGGSSAGGRSDAAGPIQLLQPGADVARRDIGLVEQLAHGEEAVELAGMRPVRHRHAGLAQP